MLQRAMTEAKAGRFAVDVFTSAGFQLELLKDSGLTQKYVPAEASAYDDGFQGSRWTLDERPLAAGHDGVQHTAGQAHEAPKRYEDLLAPKWREKSASMFTIPNGYVNLQKRWGKEKARTFLKALAAQNRRRATATISPRTSRGR